MGPIKERFKVNVNVSPQVIDMDIWSYVSMTVSK